MEDFGTKLGLNDPVWHHQMVPNENGSHKLIMFASVYIQFSAWIYERGYDGVDMGFLRKPTSSYLIMSKDY